MSLQTKSLNEASEAIRAAQTILISGHINPDGDALGSVLAIDHALRFLGKTSFPVSIDGVPNTLRFLPGSERIELTSEQQEFDLAILVDLEGLKRVGRNAEVVQRARKLLVIDHHVPWENLGDVRLIDTTSPSTTSIIYKLLRCLEIPITAAIATCLLTGLVTDTGSFKYRNTTPTSLALASRLIKAGASIVDINEEVYESHPFEAVKLLGIALDKIQSARGQELVWTSLSQADFQLANATDAESEGIVSHLRAIKTAKVAALLREVAPERVRISLRTRAPVNAAEIARAFSGGGHALAAGCSINAPLEIAEKKLLEEINRWMDSSTLTNLPG